MIDINNISFAYGEKQIFKNFSAHIGQGITVLMGDSGRGKTTLLHILAGLLTPDEGAVSGIPENVSLMFQSDRLIPWLTAWENVTAVLGKDRTAAEKWFRELDMWELRQSLPGELSGGQQRRAALIRALSYPGGLLLLDEPTKGLDEALAAKVIDLIKKDGRPVVVTTHSTHESALWEGAILKL